MINNNNNIFSLAVQSRNPFQFLQNMAKNDNNALNLWNTLNDFANKSQKEQYDYIFQLCSKNNINFNNALQQFKQYMNLK